MKGSAAHLEDILCLIGNLLEQKSVPPATSNTGTSASAGNSIGSSAAAKNKSSSTNGNGNSSASEKEKGMVSISQSELVALQKRLEELELWKERKAQEDEVFQKKVRDSFTSLIDNMTTMSFQLNKQTVDKQSASSAPVVAAVKNGQALTSKNIFVKIAVQGSAEIHEFPTDENGNLQVESVVAVYQGNSFPSFKFLFFKHLSFGVNWVMVRFTSLLVFF